MSTHSLSDPSSYTLVSDNHSGVPLIQRHDTDAELSTISNISSTSTTAADGDLTSTKKTESGGSVDKSKDIHIIDVRKYLPQWSAWMLEHPVKWYTMKMLGILGGCKLNFTRQAPFRRSVYAVKGCTVYGLLVYEKLDEQKILKIYALVTRSHEIEPLLRKHLSELALKLGYQIVDGDHVIYANNHHVKAE